MIPKSVTLSEADDYWVPAFAGLPFVKEGF